MVLSPSCWPKLRPIHHRCIARLLYIASVYIQTLQNPYNTDLYTQGYVRPEFPIWKQGMAEWVAFSQVPEASAGAHAPTGAHYTHGTQCWYSFPHTQARHPEVLYCSRRLRVLMNSHDFRPKLGNCRRHRCVQ